MRVNLEALQESLDAALAARADVFALSFADADALLAEVRAGREARAVLDKAQRLLGSMGLNVRYIREDFEALAAALASPSVPQPQEAQEARADAPAPPMDAECTPDSAFVQCTEFGGWYLALPKEPAAGPPPAPHVLGAAPLTDAIYERVKDAIATGPSMWTAGEIHAPAKAALKEGGEATCDDECEGFCEAEQTHLHRRGVHGGQHPGCVLWACAALENGEHVSLFPPAAWVGIPTPATAAEAADRAVGYCRHVNPGYPHDWACARCIAYWVERYAAQSEAEAQATTDVLLELTAPAPGHLAEGPPGSAAAPAPGRRQCSFCSTSTDTEGVQIYSCEKCERECCTAHSDNGPGQTLFCERCIADDPSLLLPTPFDEQPSKSAAPAPGDAERCKACRGTGYIEPDSGYGAGNCHCEAGRRQDRRETLDRAARLGWTSPEARAHEVAIAREQERERCAKIADMHAGLPKATQDVAKSVAAAIRARASDATSAGGGE